MHLRDQYTYRSYTLERPGACNGHEPVIGQPIGTIATKALSAPTVSRGLQRSATLGKDTYLRDSVNPTKSGDSKR